MREFIQAVVAAFMAEPQGSGAMKESAQAVVAAFIAEPAGSGAMTSFMSGVAASFLASILFTMVSRLLLRASDSLRTALTTTVSRCLFYGLVFVLLLPPLSWFIMWLCGIPSMLGFCVAASSASPIVGVIFLYLLFLKIRALGLPSVRMQSEIESFKAGARGRGLDPPVLDALCRMRDAMQEIAEAFDPSFVRGKCVDPGMLSYVTLENHITGTAEIETKLRDILKRHIGESTDAKLLSDESVLITHSDPQYLWILDPLDGGRHFRRQLPLFTSCAAFLARKRDGEFETQASMIYVPNSGELFFAVKSKGAFLNDWGHPIHVSPAKYEESLVYAEFPSKDVTQNKPKDLISEDDPEDFREGCEILKGIFEDTYRVRGLGLGSLGLAYVAKGAFDLYVTMASHTLVNDVAAGILMVQEAGGSVRLCRRTPGSPDKFHRRVRVIAGNREIVDALVSSIPTDSHCFPGIQQLGDGPVEYYHDEFD